MRVFSMMRQAIMTHNELLIKMQEIEQKVNGQGHEIVVLFEYLKKLMQDKESKDSLESRKRIGYKKDND